jgi:DNA-directed RNA polymerase subunit RPC12/RpoP
MRGHIRRRGDPGSWEFIIDVGMATAQRCSVCGKRFWMERKPKAACPKCGGALLETEERRRKTQAGFATRKECEAAMNKALTAVEEHTYVVPSRITVREYLLKEWLPAIKGTIRPTTYASYTMHVEGHILPRAAVIPAGLGRYGGALLARRAPLQLPVRLRIAPVQAFLRTSASSSARLGRLVDTATGPQQRIESCPRQAEADD